TASARRLQLLTPDRGTRVEQKILHLLANVQADGNQPLAEVVVATLPQLRRGMTLCIVTGSTEREWVRALSGLRRRGVGVVVVLVDRHSFLPEEALADDEVLTEEEGSARRAARAELAACRHALAEYDITTYSLAAGVALAETLGRRSRVRA